MSTVRICHLQPKIIFCFPSPIGRGDGFRFHKVWDSNPRESTKFKIIQIMKLKNYLEILNVLIAKNQEILESEVYGMIGDDENALLTNSVYPSVAFIDKKDLDRFIDYNKTNDIEDKKENQIPIVIL